jgi:hypothetical protein
MTGLIIILYWGIKEIWPNFNGTALTTSEKATLQKLCISRLKDIADGEDDYFDSPIHLNSKNFHYNLIIQKLNNKNKK